MTAGPPPSAAGPSHNSSTSTRTQSASSQPSASTQHATAPSAAPFTSQYSVQSQSPYYGGPHVPAFAVAPQTTTPSQASQPYPQTGYYTQRPPSGTSQSTTYPYYGYSHNAWANAWNTGTYQYPSGGNYSYPYAAPPQHSTPSSAQPPAQPAPAAQPKQKTPTPSPSPPPPEYHKDWDAVIKSFLSTMGFSQALKGFEADMLILNPEWERKKAPVALAELMKDLLKLGEGRPEGDGASQERSLDERKLGYVHLGNGETPQTPSSITKDISRFLAQNRARNDASNRSEFLLSLAEKRRCLNENGDPSTTSPSCARADAKTQNRDLQMKYDIAKNEDGPLRRTMKADSSKSSEECVPASKDGAPDDPTVQRYPALDARLQNVEKHLAIRYVPSPPRSLLDRLKFLEDHIVHLEKEYPPWAALHFSQPRRGWPPPPRATPIVVPSHLTSTATREGERPDTPLAPGAETAEIGQGKVKGRQGRSTKSSLHRAVMEKLEVQKAMNDLVREERRLCKGLGEIRTGMSRGWQVDQDDNESIKDSERSGEPLSIVIAMPAPQKQENWEQRLKSRWNSRASILTWAVKSFGF